MPVIRALWAAGFSDVDQPGWPCPRCRLGTLVFRKDSLAVAETAESRINEGEFPNCAEMYEGRFACLFVCSRSQCGEPVAVTGVVGDAAELLVSAGTGSVSAEETARSSGATALRTTCTADQDAPRVRVAATTQAATASGPVRMTPSSPALPAPRAKPGLRSGQAAGRARRVGTCRSW